MTLTQPQRVALGRLLSHLRPDWDDSGVHSACATLAEAVGSPFELVVQAVTQAAVAAHRTPQTILKPLSSLAPVHRLPGVRPEVVEPCPTHGGTIRNHELRYACCLNDTAEPLPVVRRSHPVPVGVRAQIETLKNAGKK